MGGGIYTSTCIIYMLSTCIYIHTHIHVHTYRHGRSYEGGGGASVARTNLIWTMVEPFSLTEPRHAPHNRNITQALPHIYMYIYICVFVCVCECVCVCVCVYI